MTALIVAVAIVLVTALVILVWRWRDPEKLPHRITPAAERILFPLLGDSVSRSALDATLRMARAEHATLVPAYLAVVPLHLPLDAPLPHECERAMPLLETIEQRAARLGVPVDSRIESGRTPRHALRELLDEERFDRIVVPAATANSSGFDAEDIAWLLENAPGEIAVLRAEQNGGGPRVPHSHGARTRTRQLPRRSVSRRA
jgi:nucleotide-binding universal stress UspA family protein